MQIFDARDDAKHDYLTARDEAKALRDHIEVLKSKAPELDPKIKKLLDIRDKIAGDDVPLWRIQGVGGGAACGSRGAELCRQGFRRASRGSRNELMQATRRYFEHTIDRFGVDRCMLESNFPVDKLSCSYIVLWNSFKLLTKDYSAAERAALFHDTATRVYRL